MAARRPNLAFAAADLGFALAAFAAGALGAPLWGWGLVLLAASAVWAWTRLPSLRRTTGSKLAVTVAVSIAVLAGVLGFSFWLGSAWKGTAGA